RLETGKFPAGRSTSAQKLAESAVGQMRAALDDDMNTAAAQAAIFDMVRDANAAADKGEIRQEDLPVLLDALARFDEIFDVLTDPDAEKIPQVHDWPNRDAKP